MCRPKSARVTSWVILIGSWWLLGNFDGDTKSHHHHHHHHYQRHRAGVCAVACVLPTAAFRSSSISMRFLIWYKLCLLQKSIPLQCTHLISMLNIKQDFSKYFFMSTDTFLVYSFPTIYKYEWMTQCKHLHIVTEHAECMMVFRWWRWWW